MARRRRSRVSDFIQGFEEGFDSVGRVLDDIEMTKIAKAAPETSEGFTAEQGAQLEAAAKSGQYDIGYDEAAKAYTVTPKADPSQVGRIAQQGVTDFLGNRTAGSMSEGQVDRARTMAQAGVLGRSNPAEAMRLRQQVKAGERDDARWDRQTKEWDRQDADQQKKDEYDRGRQEVFSSLRFGRNQQEFAKQQADYQKALAEHEAAKAEGKAVGAAPTAPVRPEYSLGDSLADRAALIEHDAKHGKLDARSFGEFTDLLNKAQSEGYEKALRLAQSGAPAAEVAKAFNASGKMQLDPAAIVSDKVVKGKDGVETRVLQIKDAQGNLRTVNTLAELDALGKANEVFTRFYQSEQNRRGNEQLQLAKNSDARAGAAAARTANDAAQEKADKVAKADAAVAIFKERNPNASAAELEAVRRGVIEAVPTADKNAPAEVKLAQAYRRAGLAKDDAEALRMATQSKSDSPEKTRAEIYGKALAANFGNAEQAKKATDEAMSYLFPGGGSAAPAPTAKPAKPLENVTPADIKATAQKYGISEDEVRRRLGMK